jgi:hypothetical protein
MASVENHLAMTRTTRVFLLLALAMAGCGGGDDAPDSTPAVGATGNTTGGGSSAGGGASGGFGGTGGSPRGGSVLDPTLAPPTYDCVGDAVTRQCVSISGVIAGRSIDRHCARSDSPLTIFGSPYRWLSDCIEQDADGTAFNYRVEVPVQDAGPFQYTLDPNDYVGADVLVIMNDAGGELQSDHSIGGLMAGLVEVDPATENDIITGTFRAAWGEPDATCRAGFPDTCASAHVHGNFRVRYSLSIEDF